MPRRKRVFESDPESKPAPVEKVEQTPEKPAGLWGLTILYRSIDVEKLTEKIEIHTGLYDNESKAYFAAQHLLSHGIEFELEGVFYFVPHNRILLATVRKL